MRHHPIVMSMQALYNAFRVKNLTLHYSVLVPPASSEAGGTITAVSTLP